MKRLLIVLALLALIIAPASAEAYFNPTYFAYMHFTNGTDIPSDYLLQNYNIDIKIDPIPIAENKIGGMYALWCTNPNDRTSCGVPYKHNQNWWNTYATLTTDTYKTSDAIANTSAHHYYTVFWADDPYQSSNIFDDVTLMYITRNSTIPVGPPTPVYRCNFPYSTGDNPSGVYVQSPFSLACTDHSTANPAVTAVNWTLTQPDATTYKTGNASLVRTLTQEGWYGLEFEACNTYGCGYSDSSTWLNLSAAAPPQYGISLLVDIKDAAFPHALIQGASFGFQNTTSLDWGNTTAATGALELVDILGIPLSQGQEVKICAGATGYQDACDTFTIPYDGYLATLHLTKDDQIPSGGNWNLIVKTIQNLDHKPVMARVEVTTGVSGPGVYSGGTDASTGTVSFMNISASTTATITVIAQAYQPASKTIPVIANSTQTVTFELVRIGQTPVATPIIPTTTTTYSSPGGSVPVPTNPSTGQPISEAEEYAEFGIMEMVKMVPTWIKLLIGIITMALLWGSLYWMRGGKYRKKGRGGWN